MHHLEAPAVDGDDDGVVAELMTVVGDDARSPDSVAVDADPALGALDG